MESREGARFRGWFERVRGGEGMKVQGFGGCEDELKTMVILGLSDCGKSGRSCRRDFVRGWSRFRAGGFVALWSVSEV